MRTQRWAVALFIITLVAAGATFGPPPVPVAAAGSLTVAIQASYNLVVDSNASSPSTYAPSVATVAGMFCNPGTDPLYNVQVSIGDYDPNNDGNPADSTPGLYPGRDSTAAPFPTQHPALANTGWYYFTHVGGSRGLADATRLIPVLPAGECRVAYWHFTYPQCSEVDRTPPCSGVPVWGDSVKPDDDLWLTFDIWGQGLDRSGVPVTVWGNASKIMTMRNEISAMANKIKPNPDGDWFNTKTDNIEPGGLITTNGILYELGVINQGFDNDGDYIPDYNGWMQPVGDASYDPSCFRLVRTSSILTVTRSGGNPDLVLHTSDLDPDPVYGGPLYFTNLPSDNTGTRGEVFYTFQAQTGPCQTTITPYQEVASGFDNEKFNGDYGTGIPPLGSVVPKVTIDKSASPTVIPLGSTTTYQIPFANTGTTPVGMGLSSGGTSPLVISDTVPNGLQYVGASATQNLTYSPNTGVTRLYSTDSGRTWSDVDPGTRLSTWPNSKVIVQWWLNDSLPAGNTGSYAQYQAAVPLSYTGPSFIDNCADGQLDGGEPFARACATIMVQGNNKVGDWVWRDENTNAIQDDGSTGINAIGVTLYWDKNGDQKPDAGDVALQTMDTYTYLTTNGYYTFTGLPDANYLVVVDTKDANLPIGYGLTTAKVQAVALDPLGGTVQPVVYRDADFGFGPSLKLGKTLTSENPSWEGDLVTYRIAVMNSLPGDGTGNPAFCSYKVWAGTGTTGASPKNFVNYTNAFAPAGPDALYAYGDFATGANKYIEGRTYSSGNHGGTITKVEVVFQLYVGTTLVDDFATLNVYSGTTALNPTAINISTADLNGHVGAANVGLLGKDITAYAPGGTWDWNDFRYNLGVRLDEQKSGGGDAGILYLDAIGFRVTTDQQCGDPDGTIDPLPLTDTFDPAKLQFISASPAQTSVAGGTITWSNVGPLYPGQTKYVSVTFKALPVAGSTPITHQNCASSTGAQFADGRPVNDASACVTHNINPTANIGDTIWGDQNSNGILDAGEQGIPNVRVFLCAGSGTCNASNASKIVYTNAAGQYLFEGVRDGPWTVSVDTATLPPGWAQTYDFDGTGGASANRSVTTIASAVDDLRQDFGYTFPAALYGNVWEDADGDSNKETGDTGIAGVTVYLCSGPSGTPCTSSNAIQTTTTDANGNYRFGNLTAGVTYYVGVANTLAPLGPDWTNTRDPEGAPGNSQFAGVTVAASRLYGSYDFGYYRAGTFRLGDTVYTDWDGDGTQDAGDEGIPNITVNLYEDDDGDGVVDPEDGLVAVTVTNATGNYYFPNRGAGSYIVIVDKADPDFPPNYRQTADPDESGVCATCDSRGVATLGPNDLTVDFGYQPYGAASIGDFVWRDMDHDGVQDGGSETGIANITVNLYEDSNGNGVIDAADALVATTSTDANGNYLFTELRAGRYLVDVDTADPDLPEAAGKDYVLSTANDPQLVVLAAGQAYREADFGFTPGGVIGDYIWQDNDGDGIQDLGEPGISGVTVQLYNCGVDGVCGTGDDVLVGTATTNGSGLYEFTGLPAGEYRVQVGSGIPAGYQQTGDPDLTVPCSGGTCDGRSDLTLAPGQVDRSRDFGYQPLVNLGDFIWLDLNGDGVQDAGEPGLAGVVVTLTLQGGGVYTTRTDESGYYAFGGVPNGTHQVSVRTSTLPAGVSPTYDLDGTGTPHTTSVTVNGASRWDVDFGYNLAGAYSISGYVFYDSGNDGGQYNSGVGDLPYNDIPVYLWKDGLLVGVTTTNSSGYYVFPGLPNGNYTVSMNPGEPQLQYTTMNVEPDILPGKCGVCNNYTNVTISGSSVTHRDFGFYSTLDLGDLPDSYGTRLGSDGARHVVGSLYLGTAVDADGDSVPVADATSDDSRGVDDEEGILFAAGATWQNGSANVFTATANTTGGYLVVWFDWNGDGDFGETNETWVVGPISSGANRLSVTVPTTATMSNYANMRFRLYEGRPLVTSPKGLAVNGEVEDYRQPISPTAVKLLSFTASGRLDHVVVTWETATEENNVGFNLYRRAVGTQEYLRLNLALIPSAAPGWGQGASYTFADDTTTAGVTYEYVLEDVDLSGTRTPHGPVTAMGPYAFFIPSVYR